MLRPMRDTDPQQIVDAPVRRALLELVVRGIALVAVVLMLVLGPSVPSLAWTRDLANVLLAAVLFGVAGLVRLERHIRGRPSEPARADAWARITASRPSMAGYQEKTDRILPVLRLTPAE